VFSTIGRLARERALSQRSVSSSLSLVADKGLLTLLLELDVVGPLHALESEPLEPLWTLSLTSGTRSLPWAPGWRRDRSRLGERAGKERVDEAGDAGVAFEL
jgi:hypothetical protein